MINKTSPDLYAASASSAWDDRQVYGTFTQNGIFGHWAPASETNQRF